MNTNVSTPQSASSLGPLPGSNPAAQSPGDQPSGAQRSLGEQAAAVNDHEDRVSVTRRVVDGLASDAASIAVSVEQTLEDVVGSPEEWAGAARTVVRANPLLAIGGAALIGLAIGVLGTKAVSR